VFQDRALARQVRTIEARWKRGNVHRLRDALGRPLAAAMAGIGRASGIRQRHLSSLVTSRKSGHANGSLGVRAPWLLDRGGGAPTEARAPRRWTARNAAPSFFGPQLRRNAATRECRSPEHVRTMAHICATGPHHRART
jgi:hypothetical protein